MPWEIPLIILAIIALIAYKKRQHDNRIDNTIHRLPAVVLNKDIESRLLKYHYFIAFRIDNNRTTIFEVTEADYYATTIGDSGTVMYQHHSFLRFDRHAPIN